MLQVRSIPPIYFATGSFWIRRLAGIAQKRYPKLKIAATQEYFCPSSPRSGMRE
jgi:hypothetical protein